MRVWFLWRQTDKRTYRPVQSTFKERTANHWRLMPKFYEEYRISSHDIPAPGEERKADELKRLEACMKRAVEEPAMKACLKYLEDK